MAFFPPGQGRKGQGIRAGQVEKKCPVDITVVYDGCVRSLFILVVIHRKTSYRTDVNGQNTLLSFSNVIDRYTAVYGRT
jgi:hypothetical protein